MTPSEFKAWFEGFAEGIEGVPTLKQWEKIKQRASEIDGRRTVETVFVDRYWPGYPYYPRSYWPPHVALYNSARNDLRPRAQAMSANNVANMQNQNLAEQLRGPDQFTLQAQALKQAQHQVGQLQDASYAADQTNNAETFDVDEAMRELGRKERSEIN